MESAWAEILPNPGRAILCTPMHRRVDLLYFKLGFCEKPNMSNPVYRKQGTFFFPLYLGKHWMSHFGMSVNWLARQYKFGVRVERSTAGQAA